MSEKTGKKIDMDQVKEVMHLLAKKGIIALYGGRKGHGFWLAQTTPENALKFFHDPNNNLGLEGESLVNDGKESGNPHFWMFEAAKKLALENQTETRTNEERLKKLG